MKWQSVLLTFQTKNAILLSETSFKTLITHVYKEQELIGSNNHNLSNVIHDDNADVTSQFVGNSIDINYIELLAVSMALQKLLSNNHPALQIMTIILVLCDNQQVINWLSGDINTNDEYIYDLVV